jgi:hypothetical protein
MTLTECCLPSFLTQPHYADRDMNALSMCGFYDLALSTLRVF